MSKTTSTRTWHILLASMVAFMFAGCGIMARTITPTQQSPTSVPPYIHYTQSEGSNILLEFDYPSSWVFREEKREAGIIVISLGDSRFRTLPTSSINDLHSTPKDFGSVNIWIFPSEPGRTLETKIESLKQSSSATSWITALSDYNITIDGYDANVLEYQIEPFPEGYTSLMFERRIFFAVEDQIYEIIFIIAEKDRGGEFEKGYEYFFNSLDIVP